MLINHDLVMQICIFTSDSKQSVKNKVRVEGSICASYLHREITPFCSYYFNNFTLSPCNIRHEIAIETERCPPVLLVFDQQGHPSGKELIHWLTNHEKDLVHVHMLINYAKVKSYLE